MHVAIATIRHKKRMYPNEILFDKSKQSKFDVQSVNFKISLRFVCLWRFSCNFLFVSGVMEKSFDFGRILKKHVKQKPVQFSSVAGGVKKRLEASVQNRKSTRLTVFDKIRNISSCESPAPVPDTKSKSEHRRLQLEKWKEEKEKQKKEAAAKKKKPFLVGVAHAPLKFVPPPPPKAVPSTSGRVTRSQASKKPQKSANQEVKPTQSFAPKNAPFRPPNLNLQHIPTLAPLNKKVKKSNINYSFQPVLPNTQKQNTRQTRSKAAAVVKPVIPSNPTVPRNTRSATSTVSKNMNGWGTQNTKSKKPSPKPKKFTAKDLQSSSSSDTVKSDTQSSSDQDMASSIEKSPILGKAKSSSIETDSTSSIDVDMPISKTKRTPRKSLPKDAKLSTPKPNIPKSESSSEEKLRSPKSVSDVEKTPDIKSDEGTKISPCVTMSRGKDNARREMKKKIDEGLLDDDASDMDSVEYFRSQLDSEIRRILERCDLWDKIMADTVLPESVQELALGAVGQGRLLVGQKLRQFGALLQACERPVPGAALVTPADLRGFWDMVFMQVENIDMRFKKLETLRQCNWVEEKPVEVKKKVVKNIVKKPSTTTAGPSRLREMIAAARKAKKQQEPQVPPSPQPEAESKTFDAGFFRVSSPVRSPAASPLSTPVRKNTLLKAVLSSEAKKSASKSSASFAILRASVLSKNMDHEGIGILPQTPVNLSATPGRSILKSANKASTKKSSKKSIKVVLFDDNDTDLVCADDDKENSSNSSRKLKLVRQDAVLQDSCGVMTRSRRKSLNLLPNDSVPEITPKRSAKKKA